MDAVDRDVAAEKQAAAEAAAAVVTDGMTVGLGTGSTVAYLLAALACRHLSLRCVATSPATAVSARAAGLVVEEFDALDRLDIAIDGADQVAPVGWLVKGGGGAHTREKIVAAAAERFVVIADASKPVDALAPPVPLELHAFGLAATVRRLQAIGPVDLRPAPPTADGGILADYRGPVEDPGALAIALDADPGVVAHGLFAPGLVTDIVIGRGTTVDWQELRRR